MDPGTALELQNLAARFANSFDLKDWDRLGECLADSLYTDYRDLRGTPPETMPRERFVELRRAALQELRTQHLCGNIEIALDGTTADMKLSMLIHRRDGAGEAFDTHCLYLLRAVRGARGWRINSITQKVLANDGNSAIHKGARQAMILESAVLDVKPDLTREFEAAFGKAQAIISASKGYVSHELRRCLEKRNRYLLLVRWRTLEDHTEGFRKSAPYREWRRLLHHFYDPFPVVEHYEDAF